MTHNQKIILTGWLLLLLALICSAMSFNLGFLAFAIFIMFLLYNAQIIKEINFARPTPVDVISESVIMKLLALIYLAALITFAFYALFTGIDLGNYIKTPIDVLLLVFFPIIPAIIISQIQVFKKYGENGN